jgi:TonB family protein
MTRDWKSWEGEVANKFPLRQYLGGIDTSAVFRTDRAGADSPPAAIKVVLADPAHPDARLRWWDLTSRLSHPNLLTVYETGSCQLQDTEVCYIVMEYAEEDLSHILPERALTQDETKQALLPILDALTYIHAKGYVHGHLKPANILAIGDKVKLSSDGLCGVGESGKALGPATDYTAPEVANGGAVSPQADVWSLGVMIPEMLTQKLPEKNSGLQSRLPEPFAGIVNSCLRPEPTNRPSISEIATKLKAGPAAQQTAPQAAISGTVKDSKGRNRLYAVLGFLIVAVLLAGLFLRGGSKSGSASSAVPTSSEPGPTASTSMPSVNSTVPSKKTEATDNVSSANCCVAGKVAQRTMPDVSGSAIRTINGKVRVRIRASVDTNGKVSNSKFDSQGPSKYFASRAMEAARQWTFVPPTMNGEKAASNWLITFEFTRRGVDDRAEEVGSSTRRR